MSVRRNYNTGNSYLKPSSDNEFIEVSVKLENETDGEMNVNPYDFKVPDGSGTAGLPPQKA